jgi:hypothetical protein
VAVACAAKASLNGMPLNSWLMATKFVEVKVVGRLSRKLTFYTEIEKKALTLC